MPYMLGKTIASGCALAWVHRGGKSFERKEQPKHHLLVIAWRAGALAHMLRAVPLVIVQTGALPVEEVDVVRDHHAACPGSHKAWRGSYVLTADEAGDAEKQPDIRREASQA